MSESGWLNQLSPSPSILVIDDEPVARLSLSGRLKKLGYRVLEAPDGVAGLAAIRRERPDLVIVDWMMPGMDGPTLCETLRNDADLATSQVIMMTSHDQPEQIAEGLARGADDFLSKAASKQEIVARVQAGLRAHALVTQLEQTRDDLNCTNQALVGKQKLLDEDLASASRFVRSLLPEPGRPTAGVEMAWQYLPSSTLGGDLFGVARWGREHLGLFMLDASGHGVSAALRSAAMATFLHPDNLIRVVGAYIPEEIVAEANRRFPMTPEGEYFTLWIGALHLPTWTLRYVSAGHAGAVLCGATRQSTWLSQRNLPLGFASEAKYQSESVSVDRHDRLYLLSDGVYETMSSAKELWGRERLQMVLERHAASPLHTVIEQCLHTSRAWQQKDYFDDDAALVGLERTGS
jgi:sigma-B regulation protein RsbU (phosphoserine phosphatase)